MTIQRRILTVKGIKPLQPYQHKFKNLYLYGAFSPVTGTQFTLELPQCNTDCFQLYLDEFSRQMPDEFKIIILDNGAFHKAAHLKVPENIALLFIPPYTPELNAAEKIWRYLKDAIATQVFATLECLSERLCNEVRALSAATIKSITGYQLYLDNFNDVF